MKVIEIIGTLLGICGTILLSTKLASERKYRLIVFVAYLFSGLFMSIVMLKSKLYGAATMQIVYIFTSLNGIRSNWR